MITDINSDLTDLSHWLTCDGSMETTLYRSAAYIRNKTLGNNVHLRGLIEISNICRKDCLYCGIRKSNTEVSHYTLSDDEIIEAAMFAYTHQYGSVVLQGGERTDKEFRTHIGQLVKEIKKLSNNRLGITLSLGEQDADTYQYWFDCGAHRYLLRIETSNETLYKRIHPDDGLHTFKTRLKCIETIQKCGYQTGSGVMIGLPFQTVNDLAADLLFLKSMDVDMVGMGPYLEHHATPLYSHRDLLLSQDERLRISLHMIACLRLLMPDINIAATTALQAIDSLGREKALSIGANVIMPNITPTSKRADYKLYQNKPISEEGGEEALSKLEKNIQDHGCKILFSEWGDSLHYQSEKTISPEA